MVGDTFILFDLVRFLLILQVGEHWGNTQLGSKYSHRDFLFIQYLFLGLLADLTK